MDEIITINSKFKSYNVYFEENVNFLKEYSRYENTIYAIDRKVYELYNNVFVDFPKDKIVFIDAVETNKTIDTALDICEKITSIDAKRNALLISIGGGIVQDITGFVANITYRGIKWIFIPTTLLAACDSCIGGKTSLNYKKYKNLLGTFFPPDEIHICSEMFKTLSDRDFKSGLGEVVKFNIMSGRTGLNRMENNIDKLINRDQNTINQFVHTSLNFKKKFIEVDEFDRGERIKLNFAHTFGHAIETITKYEIPHGTAVAIGMIMANYVSYLRNMIDENDMTRSEELLLKIINIDINLLNVDIALYVDSMRKDKKQVSKDLTAVLISKYDNESTLSIIHDLSFNEVKEAVNHFISIYEVRNEN